MGPHARCGYNLSLEISIVNVSECLLRNQPVLRINRRLMQVKTDGCRSDGIVGDRGEHESQTGTVFQPHILDGG